jgi:glycine/D-amino acid oxidase-like deaminating enzyme
MTGTTFDVVVVGNGAVGLSIAAELVRQLTGSSVAVLGPSHRRGGASAAAGAMLGCFGEVTRHSLASDAGRERFALQIAAHRRWPGELEELGRHSEAELAVADDTYVVLNSRGGRLDSANFEAMLTALDQHAQTYDVVSEVPALNPVPDARPLRAIRLPAEGAVHSGRLLQAMERRARSLGAQVLDTTVRRLVVAGGRVTGVELDDSSELAAGEVVVAAGAFTTPLLAALPDADAVPPVLAGSGLAYVAERVMGTGLTSAVRTVTRAGSCGLHAVPLGGGVEYFGATNVIFGAPELRPHLGVCQFLAEGVIDQIDRLASFSRIDELRVGNRPVAFDTFPLLGPGPVPGVWVVGGGYRDGLHAAPELADLAAQSVIEGKSRFPDRFAACRPPLSTMSVDASVDDFVDQQVASAFEGGVRLTPFQGVDDLDRMYRPLAEALYERLGISCGLAPDIVNYLCLTRKSDADVERAVSYLRAVGLAPA